MKERELFSKRNAHLLLLPLALLSLLSPPTLASVQAQTDTAQVKVNKRVDEIMDRALKEDVFTTPEGVRVTPMGANVSSEAMQEIQTFGDQAIAPLAKYLDSPDRRAQTLATKLLGAIGGSNTIKPLIHAAEKCTSSIARTVALFNLERLEWKDVGGVIERVALNDSDLQVRKTAQDIIAKHQAK